MPVIDSDAHVVESEHTWDYMDASDARYRPEIVYPKNQDARGRKTGYWYVDGKLRGLARTVMTDVEFRELSERAGRTMDTPEEAREMENVGVRLAHMDQLGIDVQVVYPTAFIEKMAERPEVDVAICKSYNRWLADIWQQSQNRLRWACVLPLETIPEALEQLRYSHQNGAVAVFMRSIEGDKLLHDPSFYPVFEEAEKLDMCIGVHIANSNPEMVDLLTQRTTGGGTFWKFRLSSVGEFHSLVMTGVPDLFPKLRWGFLEASAQWLPYALKDLKRRFAFNGRQWPENVLEANRLWVSCQTDDDIEYIAGYVGENHLVIGTDYGHNDQSTEIEALRNLRESGQIQPALYKKITDDNARALYSLN
jgi:predicted TIM-barrel fold metal-dependent hydrolase